MVHSLVWEERINRRKKTLRSTLEILSSWSGGIRYMEYMEDKKVKILLHLNKKVFSHGKNGNPTSVEALYAYGVSKKICPFKAPMSFMNFQKF